MSGLSNPEEFSFTSDEETQEQTSRRQHQQQIRDHKKLDTLKKKLHTDDECKWSLAMFDVHVSRSSEFRWTFRVYVFQGW